MTSSIAHTSLEICIHHVVFNYRCWCSLIDIGYEIDVFISSSGCCRRNTTVCCFVWFGQIVDKTYVWVPFFSRMGFHIIGRGWRFRATPFCFYVGIISDVCSSCDGTFFSHQKLLPYLVCYVLLNILLFSFVNINTCSGTIMRTTTWGFRIT